MKKLPSFSSTKTAFLLSGFLVLLTILSSCDNFLKSSETAQDIKDAIAYNNAPEYTILLKSTDNQLSFLSANEKIIKLGYSAQVDFTVNVDDFMFSKLEAVSKSDTSVSRADCVQFEYLEEDAIKGMYKVKITLVKAQNDIQIQPVCLEYPKVISYSPAETQTSYSNMPVTINFNVPVDDSVTSMIELSMKNYNQPQHFFDAPVLSQDKKTVTLTPKPLLINNYMTEEEINSISISVHVKDDVTATVGETVLPLKKNENQSFTVTYQPQADYNAPIYKEGSFFVTRTPLTANTDISTVEKLSKDVFIVDETHVSGEVMNQGKKIYENRMGGHVYLYGSFMDKDSGIGTIKVYEEFKGSSYYDVDDYGTFTTDYTADSNDIQFFTGSDGYTNFYIKHTLKSDDGAVYLHISAIDTCGNKTESSDEILGFKTSFQGIGDINITNELPNITNYTEQQLSQNLRSICLKYDAPLIYGISLYEFADEDTLAIPENLIELTDIDLFPSIICNTNGITKNKPFIFHEDGEWNIVLDEGEKLSGLTIQVTITDYMGDTLVKEFAIPRAEDYDYILTKEGDDYYAEFFYKTGNAILSPVVQQIRNSDNYKTIFYPITNKLQLVSDFTYLPVPNWLIRTRISDGNDVAYIYTESPSGIEISVNQNLGEIEEFSLENFKETNKPYKLQKGAINNLMNVYIKIPQTAWSNCDGVRILIKDKVLPDIIKIDDRPNPKDVTEYLKTGLQEYSFMARTSDLFASDTTIVLYGIKNNTYKYQSTITIPKLTDPAYDNNLPDFSTSKIYTVSYENNQMVLPADIYTDGLNLDKTVITVCDNGSGISDAYFIEGTAFYEKYGNDYATVSRVINKPIDDLSGKKIYKYNYTNTPQVKVEIEDVATWFVRNGFSFYIKDMAGNWFCGANQTDDSSFKVKTTNISFPTTNSITITQSSTLTYTRRFAYVYELNGSSWNPITQKKAISSGNSMTISDITISRDFIMVYTSGFEQKYIDDNNEAYFSCPIYAYAGSIDISGHNKDNDFLLPNGNGKTSVAVVSEHPVLVQTLVSTQPYDVCKDWDYADWLYMKKEVIKEARNERILYPSSPTEYMIYNIQTERISSGNCYCVIAHFADGHALISNVVEKK